MDERSFKSAIRNIREEMGLTQDEFANMLSIDSSTIWRLEEGNTRILNKYVYRISKKTGRSVLEILVGKEKAGILEEGQDCKEQIAALKDYYESVIANLNDYIKVLKDKIEKKEKE